MKTAKTNYQNDISYEYEISKTSVCGDCTICENRCETGISMMSNTWTPEEVQEVCDLLKEGITTSTLKSMVIK